MTATGADAANERVLLLDDPGFFRDFVAHAFELAGLRLSIVDNEAAATAALEAGDVGLLALSVGMAHLDAEAFVARVRTTHPVGSLGILALSETGLGRSDLKRLRAAGIDDFVSKLAPEEHLVFRARFILHPKGAEARHSARVAVGLPVRWRSGGLAAWSRTLTLSEGGLFVRSAAPPPPGSSVWIHLGLPDTARSLDVESVVVHVVEPTGDSLDAPGFGVRFIALCEEDRAALAAFVEKSSLVSV